MKVENESGLKAARERQEIKKLCSRTLQSFLEILQPVILAVKAVRCRHQELCFFSERGTHMNRV